MGYKLSIIIPVYNVEPYISVCLHSIFDQDASDDYEVILVNDGTQDRSMEIAREICFGRANVTIIDQENQGLSAARTRGLREAKGEYIWFVDSDDKIEEGALRGISEILLHHPAISTLMFPLYWTYEYKPQSNRKDITAADGIISKKDIFTKDSYEIWGTPRFVFSKKILQNSTLFFPVGLLHEDEYFNRVLIYLSTNIYFTSQTFYHYRIRSNSIMTSRGIRSSYDIVAIYKLLNSFELANVRKEDKKWFNANIATLLIRCYRNYKGEYSSKEFQAFESKNRTLIIRAHIRSLSGTSFSTFLKNLLIVLAPSWYFKTVLLYKKIRISLKETL